MASNYTPNYSLCQWEGSDPFTRLDFNADNMAVDAALKGLDDKINALPWSVISKVTTQTSTTEMILDLSEKDLLSYSAIELIINTNASPVSTVPHRIYLNGRRESIYTHSEDAGVSTASTDYFMTTPITSGGVRSRRIIFMPPDSQCPVAAYGMMLTNEKMYMETASCSGIYWDELTSLKIAALNSTVPLLSGSSAMLVGIAKE